MRIRSHLLLLAFGVIVSVAAFSIFLSALLVDREQRTFARGEAASAMHGLPRAAAIDIA